MRPHLRLIGDVHGYISFYIHLAQSAKYTIQLGDMGFDYSLLEERLSSSNHKVLAGNHDNYEYFENRFVKQTPHFLGDFGVYQVPEFFEVFFIRGGQSIDKNFRTWGVDWWSDEELSSKKCAECFELYQQVKPSFVISHECPVSIIPHVSTLEKWEGRQIEPSSTARLLENMFQIHKPKYWFFGHHHKSWHKMIEGTLFRCLDQLQVFDFSKNELEEII